MQWRPLPLLAALCVVASSVPDFDRIFLGRLPELSSDLGWRPAALEESHRARLTGALLEFEAQRAFHKGGDQFGMVSVAGRAEAERLVRKMGKDRARVVHVETQTGKQWISVFANTSWIQEMRRNGQIDVAHMLPGLMKIDKSVWRRILSDGSSSLETTGDDEAVNGIKQSQERVRVHWAVRFSKKNRANATEMVTRWIYQASSESALEQLIDSIMWLNNSALRILDKSIGFDMNHTILQLKQTWNERISFLKDSVSKCSFNELQFKLDFHGISFSRTNFMNPACFEFIVYFFAIQPETEFIELLPSIRLMDAISSSIAQSGSTNEDYPIWDKGITGQSQIIGIADTGLDIYSCFFYDSELGPVRFSTPDNVITDKNQRKVVQYIAYTDNADSSAGHGTHVTGILAARVSSDVSTNSDGLAYGAKIAFFDIGDSRTERLFIPDDIGSGIFQPAFDIGVKVHSNSWGSTSNRYTNYDFSIDLFVETNPALFVALAAGNCGSADCEVVGPGSVGSPSVAKNIITVGASESSGTGASIDTVASFSSRGPTFDGRIKPEIVAPGRFVLSARAASSFAVSTCGTISMAGTSQATPVVAAAGALVIEYFELGYYPTGTPVSADGFSPSAALVKSVLINGASPMGFVRNSDGTRTRLGSPPDMIQGFGRLNLENSLMFDGDFSLFVIDQFSMEEQDRYRVEIEILRDFRPLAITLCWTDPALSPSSSAQLVNDFDLILYVYNSTDNETAVIEQTWYSNGGSDLDSTNNVEKILIENPSPNKKYVVEVSLRNLRAGDKAEFSLAVSGIFQIGGITQWRGDRGGFEAVYILYALPAIVVLILVLFWLYRRHIKRSQN